MKFEFFSRKYSSLEGGEGRKIDNFDDDNNLIFPHHD